ncbi:MAG: PAAR domain-containing protein [bacterium]
MPKGPAARITDSVSHPLPPLLSPGPGSPNVLIGYLPAWRGMPLAAAAALQAAQKAADTAMKAAEQATKAAAGPAAPAAFAAEQALKASLLASMSSMATSVSAGADIHLCATPVPVPPHGPGVVIDGSATVMINNLPACRLGDTVLEALGGPNKIVKGESTVIIGG